MPYQITCATFQTYEDDFQNLAVGLVDGAIVIIDMILGIEKHFLEKHPAAITTMAFYEDKSLISGSVDGRVNISDIENLDKKQNQQGKLRFSKCQNCMDRRIPIAKVDTTSEFGLGMAVDIEGNCRFYDLIRFKKMAKISAQQARLDDYKVGQTKFRLMQNQCLEMTQDALFCIIQTKDIHRDEEKERQDREAAMLSAMSEQKDVKGGKGKDTPAEEPVVDPGPVPHTLENEILVDKMYSDEKEKLKSLNDIVYDHPEQNFYVQKSNISIFRYEDVIFTVFPHLAA